MDYKLVIRNAIKMRVCSIKRYCYKGLTFKILVNRGLRTILYTTFVFNYKIFLRNFFVSFYKTPL